MKPLNFTAVEILPGLLNRTKVQTIRSAWKEYKDKVPPVGKGKWITTKDENIILLEKPPAHSPKDRVKLYWNQRSKYKHFCRNCGKGAAYYTYPEPPDCGCEEKGIFDKLLGTAEITEVFKIEIGKEYLSILTSEMKFHYFIAPDFKTEIPIKMKLNSPVVKDIAKLDGFSFAEQMFEFFDKRYDIAEGKAFWVYRWVWQ